MRSCLRRSRSPASCDIRSADPACTSGGGAISISTFGDLGAQQLLGSRWPTLRAAHEARHQAVTRVPVDENEIRARVSEASAVEADFAILRARVHEQVYQVLTPEQQAKAKSLAAERQKRRAERVERFKQRREESLQKH